MYAEFFCFTGNKLFHNFPNNGTTLLKYQNEENFVSVDSKMKLNEPGKIRFRKFRIDTYITGFLYTIFILSLITATPLGWKRKTIALIFSFMFITCYAMLKVRLMITHQYDAIFDSNNVQISENYSFWYNYIASPVTPGYSLAVILWLSICLRKKEWQLINELITGIVSNKKSLQKSLNPQNCINKATNMIKPLFLKAQTKTGEKKGEIRRRARFFYPYKPTPNINFFIT